MIMANICYQQQTGKNEKDEVDTDNLPIRFTVYAQTYNNGIFKSYKLAE